MSSPFRQTFTISIRETTLLLWLMVVAIALPTIAFLWFMTRAMNNERAALREKSSQLYELQVLKVRQSIIEHLDALAESPVPELSENDKAVRRFTTIVESGVCDSVLILSEGGIPHYPVVAEYPDRRELTETENQANDLYEGFFFAPGDSEEVIAPVRELLSQFTSEDLRTARDTQGRHLFPNLQLLALREDETEGPSMPLVQSLIKRISDRDAAHPVPTAQKFFIADELEALGYRVELPFRDAEELALQALDLPLLPTVPGVVLPIANGASIWQLKTRNGRLVLLFSNGGLARRLQEIAAKDIDLDGVRLEIGSHETDELPADCIVSKAIGQSLPNREIRMFTDGERLEDSGFDRALWLAAALLMIVIIGLIATVAIRKFLAQSRKTELRNDFLSTVSHELKTPLTSTRMLVDTLLAGEFENPERTRQYLEIIARENERLSVLVENFLTYSRLESGRTHFQFFETQADEIANHALDAVERKFDAANVTVDVTIDSDLPLILADDATLTTAVINLLDNAFKYSGEDKKIQLQVSESNGSVSFVVRDNGIGLSEADRSKVMERFFRSETSAVRSVSGTGLGLSIVNFIVTAHQGMVSIDSKLNQGSTFTISIPTVANSTLSNQTN